MPGDNASPTISLRERSFPVAGAEERLPKWVTLSLIVHCSLLLLIVVAPFASAPRLATNPIYTVDLVGGERIGRTSFGADLGRPAKKELKATEVPAAIDPPKKEVRQEPIEKAKTLVEKLKPLEKKPIVDDRVALREKVKKEPAKLEPTKESKDEAKTETASADSVRERLIKTAAERASAATSSAQKSSKGEALSTGNGEGVGGSALGAGGRGGPGIVKGMDYVIYQNRMLSTIKNNWVWVGPRSNIKVVVHFNIKDSGEIVGLKIVQSSGNSSYDDSVLRAVRKSSPLPALSENIRNGFAEVELAFRPEDLEA
jgi:colicin import membrane protein